MRRLLAGLALGAVVCVLALPGTDAVAQSSADRSVRVVTTAYRMDVADATSLESWRAAVDAHFDDHVAPLLDPDRNNVVVYPERLDLITGFIGQRGELARDTLAGGGHPSDARIQLMTAYAPQMSYYAARFPGETESGPLLQIALSDVVARGVLETFGELAGRHGVYLAVGTALPEVEAVTGPDAELLRDPDADGPAFRATTPRAQAAVLLFGPDGELLARAAKRYVEFDETLGGTGGPGLVSATEPPQAVDTVFGRVALLAGRDAGMPDVGDRVEQLGADLVLHPARHGPWAVPSGSRAYWPPDRAHRDRWWSVQRHPGVAALASSALTGDYGSLAHDGQASIAVSAPGGSVSCLLGGLPITGWGAVGPWGGAEAGNGLLCDQGQRSAYTAAQGSGYAHGAVATDVVLADDSTAARVPAGSFSASQPIGGEGPQLDPAVAAGPDEAWLVWLDGGRAVAAPSDDGQAWGGPQTLPGSAQQAAPGVAVSSAPPLEPTPGLEISPIVGPVAVMGNLSGRDWDVTAASVDPDDGSWRSGGRVSAGGADRANSSPRVLATPDHGFVAVWSDLRWPYVVPQIRVSRSSDGQSWSDPVRADGGPPDPEEPAQPEAREPGESRGQAHPAVGLTGDGDVLVAWQELSPQGVPSISLSRSADGGETFGSAQRVDGTQGGSWRPALGAAGDRVWLAWEQDSPPGGRQVWVRVSADGGRTWDDPAPVDSEAPVGVTQRYATVVASSDGAAVVVFEDDRAGDSDVLAARITADGSRPAPLRVDDTPAGTHARAPAAALLADGRLLVAWQDDRDGLERVRTAVGAPQPAVLTAPSPTLDQPAPAPPPPVAPAPTPLPATGAGPGLGVLALLVLAGAAVARRVQFRA